MIIVVFAVLVAMILTFINIKEKTWLRVGGAVIAGIIAGLMAILVSFVPGSILGSEFKPLHTYALKNISDGHSLSGSFFLGSGTLDDTPVFFYYAQRANGTFFYDHVDADVTTIHETSGQPRIVVTQRHSKHPWLGIDPDGGETGADIYIPPGSIVQSYSLGGVDNSSSR